MKKSSIVILAGTGPGDQSLVSPAVTQWLTKADTVIYDRLACESILDLCPQNTDRIYVGKTPHKPGTTQEKINEILVNEGSQNKVVVRLKGGDPFIFGRGGEEALQLAKHNIPFKVIPAVTAAVAAGAVAGIPLTHRGLASTVTFITGHEDPKKEQSAINYEALARLDTLVFYMGVGNLESICSRLVQAGKSPDTPAAVVENATLPNQRTTLATLKTLPRTAEQKGICAPAVLIIGQVARLHKKLNWQSKLPLGGLTVGVTRPVGQSEKITTLLQDAGASVISLPAIEIRELENFELVDDAIERMNEFDWIVFTSPNGVRCFIDRCRELMKDSRIFKGTKIAVMGPGTAAKLNEYFLLPDIVPQEYTSQVLADALIKKGLNGKKILLARTDIAPPDLPQKLKSAGGVVEQITVYHTRCAESLPEQALKMLARKQIDWITFTSSSTAECFFKLTEGIDLSGVKFASIGPVTTQTLADLGRQPQLTAHPHTIEALAGRVVDYHTSTPASH